MATRLHLGRFLVQGTLVTFLAAVILAKHLAVALAIVIALKREVEEGGVLKN